ncbi:MAG: DNA polymerase III subunit beta [Oscillospiraceae bacterium]|nr:DNA polymerase III subunit beta [Oscillospiraceae bacterium]
MKFTCSKIPLQNAVTISSRATASKSPIPLLEGILLEAKDGNVKITGYDLKTGIITNVEAEVEKEGGIVINSRLLCEIIRKMPGSEISFSVSSEYIAQISSERSVIDILGSPTADYPEMPYIDEQDKIVIEEAKLKKMIAQTNFAVSDNESRPIHTGALFETSGGQLTIVAVDGYRLALRREVLDKKDIPQLSFVVPGNALGEVERILSDGEGEVYVTLGSKNIVFKIDEITLISRRLEGEFLNYKNSIPGQPKYCLNVKKEELISSIERVSLIISEKMKSPVRCTFEDKVVKLYTASALGKASDECTTDGDGEGLEIGFNDKFFIEALKAAPAEDVTLELNSGVSPCVITPSDDSNNFLYMILPVRLKAEN